MQRSLRECGAQACFWNFARTPTIIRACGCCGHYYTYGVGQVQARFVTVLFPFFCVW